MVKFLKQKLSKSIKNRKLNVFGLFLLLSFSILLFTKLSQVYTETIDVRLKYSNLAENKIITLDSVPKLRVTVSDYGFKLFYFYFTKQTVNVDLEEDTKTIDHAFVWEANKNRETINTQIGMSSKILGISPDTVRFYFDTLSVKKVPVKLYSEISFAPGYDATDSLRIQPDSVRLIGAGNELDKVSQIETRLLKAEAIKNALSQSVQLDLPENTKGLKFSSQTVTVTLSVEKFTEGILEVPVIVNNLPANLEINYFPKAIKISYYVSLENYKFIKPSDFKIECDFNDAKSTKESFLTPRLTVKTNKVKTAKLKQDKVEYVITK